MRLTPSTYRIGPLLAAILGSSLSLSLSVSLSLSLSFSRFAAAGLHDMEESVDSIGEFGESSDEL